MKTTFNSLNVAALLYLFFPIFFSCEDENTVESCAVINEKIVEYRSSFVMDASEENCNLYREILLDYINNEACPTDSVEINNIQLIIDRMSCN